MSHILIIHPDASVRTSIIHTLQSTWKGIKCAECAPKNTPDTIPEHMVVLGTEKPPHIDGTQFIALPDNTPLRLKTLLQRIAATWHAQHAPTILTIANALVDTRSRQWTHADKTVDLTEKEIDTLVYLWRATAPVTREDLLHDVWEYAADTDTHTIETHIYRLRQKIENDPANPAFLLTNKDGYYLAVRSSD